MAPRPEQQQRQAVHPAVATMSTTAKLADQQRVKALDGVGLDGGLACLVAFMGLVRGIEQIAQRACQVVERRMATRHVGDQRGQRGSRCAHPGRRTARSRGDLAGGAAPCRAHEDLGQPVLRCRAYGRKTSPSHWVSQPSHKGRSGPGRRQASICMAGFSQKQKTSGENKQLLRRMDRGRAAQSLATSGRRQAMASGVNRPVNRLACKSSAM